MWVRTLLATAVSVHLVAGDSPSAELRPATIEAFNRYVQLTEARMTTEVKGAIPFLWVNRQPEPSRSTLLAQLNRGEVISERLQTRDGKKEIDVDGGLIHHWVGTVLLSGVPLAKARAFVQNYERYPSLFGPMIQRAKVLNHSGDQFLVQMRTSMTKLVVTVVIDADYRIDYHAISPSRLYTRSAATNLYHVESAGEPGEKRVPGDKSSGYLWRLNTYCSFEETAAGTIEQCESVSLTRGIPFGIGWMVRPFVSGIPRETLEFTLSKVRSEAGKQ